MINHPTVIVDVLSRSPRNLDRGPKFADYRLLPTFGDYLLIDSESRSVEVHRLEHGDWTARIYREGAAVRPSVDIEIDLEELDRHVSVGFLRNPKGPRRIELAWLTSPTATLFPAAIPDPTPRRPSAIPFRPIPPSRTALPKTEKKDRKEDGL